jgi:hypothetical protein
MVCAGSTLLYVGGMFLNDAVDQKFDRQYRPERPIVAGLIDARAVWALSWILLGTGLLVFFFLGKATAIFASILCVAIVVYDLIHKRTSLAPLVMASCRLLLYLLAAAICNGFRVNVVWPEAIALAVYIVGLSYLARGESTGDLWSRWPIVLLFVPGIIAVFLHRLVPLFWITLLVQAGWTAWCVWGRKRSTWPLVPGGVAGLLAGISLVDMVAASSQGYIWIFVCLFLSALLLQRIAPAT